MACSMSRASSPRTSPTMMRSGRMRREALIRSRMVISVASLELAFLVSMRTRLGMFLICSSAESSMVITRSRAGMKLEMAFRKVVLPLPVPPHTKILCLETTSFCRKSATSGVMDLYSSSFSTVMGFLENRLIVTVAPFSATGGNATCTREPSSSLASTMGLLASTVRSMLLTKRCTILVRSSSFSKCSSSCMSWPAFSTKMVS